MVGQTGLSEGHEAEITGLAPADLARVVELGEAEAYVSLCQAADPALGIQALRFGSAIGLLAPAFGVILLNRVIGVGVAEPATQAQLDAIVDQYRRSGVGAFAVQLSPSSQPPELHGWLLERGLARTDNWAKVIRPAVPTDAVPTSLRIQSIDRADAESFAAVAGQAFSMPSELSHALSATIGLTGWHHYLAYDGEVPVATGALYVRDRVGWLGAGSTLPSYRRRGAQGALMARRINDGVELGCRWLITETGEETPDRPNPSYHNMLRTGFSLAYQRPNYVWKASTP